MPVTMTNRGLFTLENVAITAATDFRQAVFKTVASAVATMRDWNFLSDVTALHTEAVAVGYARADLAGVAIAESDASDNVTIVATAPVYTSVAAGETWQFVAYYIEAATDATRTLIAIDVPAATQVTNGGNITGPAMSFTTTGS